MKNLLLCVSTLAALLAVSGIAAAQDADPPSRVARIAYITGPVSFEPASVDQWADASLNYPMTTGDNLYTDAGARAVLRIGQNSIRLNSGTNFQFVNLSDNVVQTSINSGNLGLHVRHLFDGESWEVDTPNGAVTLLRTGDYRVDTDSSRNATMVTVRAGDIAVTANNQSFPVHSGQTAYFDNSGNPPDVQAAPQPDDFDSFAASRNRLEEVPPPRYVSPDMVGYEDLDANGEWGNTPDGAVWIPRVGAGWTPYHDGHWAWVEPWGWSWVDNAPWGFAPFHYGRWAYANNRWGWYPGAVAARVYYAPALVAFVGGGGFGVGVSVGGGGGGLVGWFPLGPREVYYPSYHVSPGYIRQVNVTNTRITNINVTNINVTNINYVNRNAIVAVPRNSFVSAQPVQRAAVRIDPSQMRQAQVIGTAPRVAPQRESVLANSTGRRAAAPPAALANRPVVAKLAPPPRAVPFAAKQQMLQQHPGTPVAPAQLQTLRAQVARQNPAPGRMQIQPINTQQVRPLTPAVRPGPAPGFAQRPAQPRNVPGQPPVPVARPQNLPPASQQPQPPIRPAPPARPQAPPLERPQAQPPARPQAQPASPHAQPRRARAQPPAGRRPNPQRARRLNPRCARKPNPRRARRPSPRQPPMPSPRAPAAHPLRPQAQPPARPQAQPPARPQAQPAARPRPNPRRARKPNPRCARRLNLRRARLNLRRPGAAATSGSAAKEGTEETRRQETVTRPAGRPAAQGVVNHLTAVHSKGDENFRYSARYRRSRTRRRPRTYVQLLLEGRFSAHR